MARETAEATPTEVVTAKDRYEKLATDRQPFLDRAYSCAELTIPSLFPRPGATSGTSFPAPYQTIGAEGVNNLAAKFMLAVFPAAGAFFRIDLDEGVLANLRAKFPNDAPAFEKAKQEFTEVMARIERQVMQQFESKGARQPLFEMFKLQIVTGNALLEKLRDGSLKTHLLSNYVVKRDSKGNVLEIIVKEDLDRTTLPPRAKAIADAAKATGSPTKNDDSVELFTRVWRDGAKWRVHQELCGEIVPGTVGTYPLNKCPWLPQRFTAVANEDYGRSYVEQRIGSLRSLETLEQAIVEGTAIAAKVLFGVNEAGVTQKEIIARAANGAVVDGDLEKDVTVLRVDKAQDFSVALQLRNDLKKDLQKAFMVLAGVQRDAERVTAEEIRALVTEIDTSFGGQYSIFANELQHPLVVCYMADMAKAGALPHLPDKTVQPTITTGLDGLGRSSDLGKLQMILSIMTEALGPQAVAAALNAENLTSRLGTATGYDVKGLVKSAEELQQEAAAARQGEMTKAAIGPAIKAASDHNLAAQQTTPTESNAST